MTASCVDEEELLRLLDGELTENEAERLRKHVQGCAVCTAHSQALKRTLHQLKAPLLDVDRAAGIEDVMRGLPTAVAETNALRHRPPMARWALLGGALAAALAIGAFVVVPGGRPRSSEDPATFGARGAPMGASLPRGVGVRVFRSSGPRDTLAPGAHVRPDDAYAVGYRNLLDDPAYVLVFAVDAAGAVHWVHPTYLDPKSNPSSGALAPSTTEVSLPSAMQLDAPAAGSLRFVAILTLSPLHVLDVEALRGAELEPTSLRARWPTADVRELVTVHVDSSP